VRVAVTGAGGRLGSALVAALSRQPPLDRVVSVEAWARPAIDLDHPQTLAARVQERRPDLVVHCAAWTDVDGCAREPALALRRNGEATAALAGACVEAGTDLLYVSTNEVFDGLRTDGRPYAEDDPTAPPNPYGRSKRAGEEAVLGAFEGLGAGDPRGWIVRTAWLYGPPGDDFPAKILRAAGRAAADGTVLRLVGDEFGSPTRAADVAVGIVDLVRARPAGGVYHLVNAGRASRAEWAREVLRGVGSDVRTEDVPASTWQRASAPPRWGVLGTRRAFVLGIALRDWRAALADELPRYRGLAGASD
jgi:dTDP-4-dehydrorhamnose reductase